MPKKSKPGAPSSDMQAIGHQIGSLASVLVVAAVQFGIPLTPGQQSSILSIIAVLWALFATVYGMRHRIPRRPPTNQADPNRRTRAITTSRTKQHQIPRDANPIRTRRRADNGTADKTEPDRVL